MATTAGTTTNRGYPYPGDASTTNVPGDIKAALVAIDTDVAALNAAGNVSTTDLAASAVTTAKIADGAVTGVKIDPGAVDNSRLGTGAVDNSKVAAGAAIDKSKISGTAVIESRQVATGGPLSGGGDLSANRTLTVATAAITPIYLGLTYAAKSAGYTLTDDDYEVAFSASATATLPTAVGRAGRVFIIRNTSTSTVTVSGASVTIPATGYVVVRSNGTTWDVHDGAYADASAGLASYRWNAASGAWRLIAYDSGWRSITEIDSSGTVTGDALTASWQVSAGTAGFVRVRRDRTQVQMQARYIAAATTSPTTGLWTPTTGFTGVGYVPLSMSSGTVHHAVSAGVTYGSTSVGAYVQANAAWPAPTTLPTSLPGSTYTNPA